MSPAYLHRLECDKGALVSKCRCKVAIFQLVDSKDAAYQNHGCRYGEPCDHPLQRLLHSPTTLSVDFTQRPEKVDRQTDEEHKRHNLEDQAGFGNINTDLCAICSHGACRQRATSTLENKRDDVARNEGERYDPGDETGD